MTAPMDQMYYAQIMEQFRTDMLPEAQQALWPRLGEVPEHFVLYGGTALALRLGHRQSEDFDFFSATPFDPLELQRSLGLLADVNVSHSGTNTLNVTTQPEGVKVSFFGGLDVKAVLQPDLADNGISVASLADVFGHKCHVVQARAAYKDYIDIAAILESTELGLEHGLAFARAIYGSAFAPHVTLMALSRFDELDEPLPEGKKATLLDAVKSADLGKIPDVKPSGKIAPAPEPPGAPASEGI